MAFSLADLVRSLFHPKKEKSAFASEREAYEFCRRVYRETGGVSPELRRAFDHYRAALNDDCRPEATPAKARPEPHPV